VFLSYQQRILKEILKNYRFSGQEILFDGGYGDGSFSRLLLRHVRMVVGIDIDFNPIWNIRHEKCQFLIADVCSLPFRDRVFDISLEKDMLHYVKDPEKTLREIIRVTSEKGYSNSCRGK